MADNVGYTPGSGATVAADDIGGVLHQRVKTTWGPDGTANDADVASGKPLPVQLRGSDGTDRSNALPVSVASGQIASGAVASGAIASGAFASGSIAAGAIVAAASSIADNEDAASADGDRGVKVLFKRLDTPANSSGTDGDYEQPQMSAGRIWTSAKPEASEVHLGEVGGKTSVFSVTLSTDTSAYASGDLIADTQQMDGFFRKTDGTGVIQSITIIDEDAQGVAFYILFMTTSTSLGTENSAPNISDANLTAGLCGIVSVATTDYITLSGTKVACLRNLGIPVKAVSGTDDLYIAVLNSTGTPTFTASGLEMRIGALLD